jgi:CheY-like chemotaxis protein
MVSSGTGSVLVVDDDRELRIGLCEILVEEGYSVASAVDGADALAHLDEPQIPDVVLLDLRMPNMDGFAFLERRSASPKLREIPVIVISATPDPAAMRFSIAGVLTKPIDLVALLQLMKREVLGIERRK